MPFGLGIVDAPSLALPPVDISATNVSTLGGSGVITGQNFASGCAAFVNISGTATPLTISFVNSTKLNYTLPAGSYPSGTFSLCVTNPDGQSDIEPIFQITSVSDPQTILGANLFAWYRADSGIHTSAGLVTQWDDKGPNAINLTGSGSQTPTFNAASSSGFNAQPTVTFDGVANTLAASSTAVLGTNTAFTYVIARWVTSTVNHVATFIQASGTGYVILQSAGSSWQTSFGGLFAASKGTISTSTPQGCYGYVKGTASSAETVGCNMSNLGEATAAGTTTQPSSSAAVSIALGSRNNAAGTFGNIEIAEVIYSNVVPTTAQLNALYLYANFRYGLDATLGFTRAMNVLATTGAESRISGTGFNSSTTAQVVVGGTPTSVTATFLSSGSVSLSGLPSLSAGAYDVVLTNGNSGASLFVSKAINVITTKQPDTIFGRNCLVWNRADQVALNGTTVSAMTDLACAGWSFQNSTSADQPTYNASDSNFGGFPSMSFTGSPMYLSASAAVGDQNTKTMFFIIVCKPRAAQTGKFLACMGVTGTWRVDINGGGAWEVSAGGTSAATISAGTNRAKVEWRSSDAGGGTETIGCAVNFGTEATVTQSGNQVWATSGTIYLASQTGSSAFGQFDITDIIGLDIVPSGTPLTDFQNYLSRYGF